ncbi:HDOD domain-containing protein [Trichloromonas sp.]|uniref:HDOD domain-containing protein n=1 Tax=Trichloromonas sp. TaxID=3069249 RepID=UPI002A3C6318|nr:HDOD domain-containing protein [Trichloromonas sp.]
MNQDPRSRLFRLQDLALPSPMAQEILAVLADDQADLEEVAAIIETYPELTTRILRCANSAYYGHRGKIQSVAEAIIRVLGLSMTKALALSLSLESLLRVESCPAFREERHWYLSVLSAHLARALTPLRNGEPHPSPGAAYAAGLLHDLGIRALAALFPAEMQRVFTAETGDQRALMRELLGMDAEQAGAFLARRWGLPEPLCQAIALCRSPLAEVRDNPLAEGVAIAVVLAENSLEREGPPPFPETAGTHWGSRTEIARVIAGVIQRAEEFRTMARALTRPAGDA